jgi:hypothetical protein
LIPQRYHRVDFEGAARWQVAGECGDRAQQNRDRGKYHGIVRLDIEQQRGHQTGEPVGGRESDCDANQSQRHGLAHDHVAQQRKIGAERQPDREKGEDAKQQGIELIAGSRLDHDLVHVMRDLGGPFKLKVCYSFAGMAPDNLTQVPDGRPAQPSWKELTEFIDQQAEKQRSVIDFWFKLATGVLAVILLIAGLLGWKTIQDVKASAENEARNAARALH